MALAWDRADIAQKEILVAGQHWQVWILKMHKKNIITETLRL